jgi:multicomponent Na+:H+ antiporter subunit E
MSSGSNLLRRLPARGAVFLGLWLMLSGLQPAELLAGFLVAGLATWASAVLSPPGEWRFRPFSLAAFCLRFFRQSLAAGIDVARKALHPSSLRPGFVVYRPKILPGSMQTAFCTVMSLVPGTLPSGQIENGAVTIHCLDVDEPVEAQLALEEAALARVFGDGPDDD